MKSECKQNIKIAASDTDASVKVGVVQALTLFQDNMCEYYKRMNCDGVCMVPKCHAFWAVTKTKIRFNSPVNWLESVEIKTDICKLSGIRMNLCSSISTDKEKQKIDCLQELCGMDSDTRKLRLVDTIPFFPKDIEVVENYNDLVFEKLMFDMTENDKICGVKIGSANVDFFGHTNNVEYAKLLVNSLDYDMMKSIRPMEFEIHYIKESRCGDELKLYRKIEENVIKFELKSGEELIVKAALKYEYIGNNV